MMMAYVAIYVKNDIEMEVASRMIFGIASSNKKMDEDSEDD
jgi:hypothetical protein